MKNLGWRFPPKALSGRVVEAVAEHFHAVICEPQDIPIARLARAVGVPDCAILPSQGEIAPSDREINI